MHKNSREIKLKSYNTNNQNNNKTKTYSNIVKKYYNERKRYIINVNQVYKRTVHRKEKTKWMKHKSYNAN